MEFFQAKILECVAISFSRGSSWPRVRTLISYIGRQILYHWATWEAHNTLLWSRRKNIFTNFKNTTAPRVVIKVQSPIPGATRESTEPCWNSAPAFCHVSLEYLHPNSPRWLLLLFPQTLHIFSPLFRIFWWVCILLHRDTRSSQK